MKKFLIVNPFGIGDCLFTTPVIKALKAADPGSFIGYWSNLRVAPLLEKDPCVDQVFALSRGDLKTLQRVSFFKGVWAFFRLMSALKKERFDVCLDFSLDHRYSLLAKLLGIKQRYGFDYKGRGRFLTRSLPLEGYAKKHVVEYYLELLKFLGIPAKDKTLALTVRESDALIAKNILQAQGIREGDRLVGIFPGAGGSWGKDALIKHWPPEKFAQTADQFISQLGVKVVLLGDEQESQISRQILRLMSNAPVDLTGKITLEILPAVINNCALVITNDGGPMHMAVALGKKTVSLFGPVSEIVYGPYPPGPEHAVLKADLLCRPCYKNFKLKVCDQDKQCLKLVSVEEVYAAGAKLLG